MQLLFILFMALMILSCSDRSKPQSPEPSSYWEKLKDSFATKNLKNFVVDSQLQTSYKNFHRIHNRVIDSIVGHGTPYLYSWQENESELSAFTMFVFAEEHGSRIIYFIFDGRDSLRSATQVANKGGEGGIIYETSSSYTSKDTLVKISAATTQWDLSKPAPPPKLSRPKGDSTFFHLIFLKEGRVAEKQFAQKKELNLD